MESALATMIPQTEPVSLLTQSHTESAQPHWYAVFTCANHEKRVAEQLRMRSVEYFLPLYQSVRQWQDRRKRLELPLFPGYVFVRIPVRERLRVLEPAGVVQLVSFGGVPVPVPEEEMAAIRACLTGHVVQPHRYPQRGQRVRVLNGPLTGFTGIVVRRRNRRRLVISFELLQRSVAVEIDADDLVPHAAIRV